jgi:hypothetical protein
VHNIDILRQNYSKIMKKINKKFDFNFIIQNYIYVFYNNYIFYVKKTLSDYHIPLVTPKNKYPHNVG